jgi:hypothetical protein
MAVGLSALRTARPLPQGWFLELISVKGSVDLKAIVRLEELCKTRWSYPCKRRRGFHILLDNRLTDGGEVVWCAGRPSRRGFLALISIRVWVETWTFIKVTYVSFPGCDLVCSSASLPTFRKNLLPSSSCSHQKWETKSFVWNVALTRPYGVTLQDAAVTPNEGA